MHWITVALASSFALFDPIEAHVVKAKIPKQPVEVSLEIAGFTAGKPDNDRTLLVGTTSGGATLSVLWETNYPYLSGDDCAKRYAKESGFEKFTVGNVVCAHWETVMRDVLKQTTWHAWPVTPDFMFDIHASTAASVKGGAHSPTFSKDDFVRIVKSWRTSGQADRGSFVLPPEAYAFRDKAVKSTGDPLEWASEQCAEHSGEWFVHFYLGELASETGKLDVMEQGFSHAADLLAATEKRSVKQTHAMIEALDRAAFAAASQRKFAETIPYCTRIVEIIKSNDAAELRPFRDDALYHLAVCCAMTSQEDKALDWLLQAIQAQPGCKQRAASDEMLASLRKKPAFKTLVGG
jgi:hypothetical protein